MSVRNRHALHRLGPHFSRRRMLGGIGAAAGVIPFLGHALRADAADAAPARILVFFSPNYAMGPFVDPNAEPQSSENRWRPAGATLGAFPYPMNELDAYGSEILMLDGLDMKNRDNHHGAITSVLTGRQPRYPGGNSGDQAAATATGISLDNHLARELGDTSIVLGANCGGPNGVNRLSFLGDANPVTPIENPVQAFETIFGKFTGGDGPTPEQVAQVNRQRSVLDANASALQTLLSHPRLGAADRLKLQQHLDHTRGLEQRLADQLSGASTCGTATAPADGGGPPTTRMLAHMDVLVHAFACNLTRVGVLQMGNSGTAFGNHIHCPELGIDLAVGLDEHEDFAHFGGGAGGNTIAISRAERIAFMQETERIYYWLFAQLLGRLAAVPEGDGTMLDNTCVLWCKNLAAHHVTYDMRFMLAGGRNLGIAGGRYINYGGTTTSPAHNRLLTTCANLVGVNTTSFGDGGVDSSPLTI